MTSTDSLNRMDPETPWLGLRAFTEFTKDYFFGRDSELNDLNDRILGKPLTILFGQSGLGKSSLVQAGLAPRLRASAYLPIYIRFDHSVEADSIERQLLDKLVASLRENGRSDIAGRIVQFLQTTEGKFDGSSALWLLFHDPTIGLIPSKNDADDKQVKLVFMIDQFEEIFTLGERSERKEISDRFRDTLASMVENRPPKSLRKEIEENDELAERIDYRVQPSRFLLVMREDFLHILERWKRTIPSIMSNRVELRMLNGPQAFLAVVRPGRLRTAKPAIIPDDVGEAIVRFVAGETDAVPLNEIDAVPPLLSLVCAELNERRLANQEPQITSAQFKGRSIDILEGFYDRSFATDHLYFHTKHPPDGPRALQRAKKLIEDRLITPDGYRENISYESIAKDLLLDSNGEPISPATAKMVLDGLVERRLLTVEERLGVRRVELTHDILTRIVKSSRDKRHEEESQTRLRALKEKAEFEKAKIIKERNKLRALAIMSCLAIMAIGAATMAFSWYRQAKNMAYEAKQSEAEARDASAKKTESEALARDAEALAKDAETVALEMFRFSRSGFSRLYDEVVNADLENVPGINIKKTLDIKSQMREYLVSQLGSGQELQMRLEEDPKRIARQLTRIHLDEGRDRILVKDFKKAGESLEKAMESSEKMGLDTQEDAEYRADILLEKTRTLSVAEKRAEGAALAKQSLEDVKKLADQWPSSWRLKYTVIRLKNLINVGDKQSSEIYLRLYDEMKEVAKKSNKQFGPVLWTFTIGANGQTNQVGDPDYQSAIDLIRSFRLDIIKNSNYTLFNKQEASDHFSTFIGEIKKQLQKDNNQETVEVRRAFIEELETTVAELERVIRSSISVYNVRTVLLDIQQAGVARGINSRGFNQINTARERLRIMGSHLGIGASFVESFVNVVREYIDTESTAKDDVLVQLQQIARDFETMDLRNADAVMSDFQVTSAVEALPPTDPVAAIFEGLLDRYLFLYREETESEREPYLQTVINLCRNRISKWNKAGDHEKINEYYGLFLRNASLKTRTQDDQSVLIEELRSIALAMISLDKPEDAEKVWDDAFSICQSIIDLRPWDFYIYQAQFGLCFEAAREWDKLQRSDNTQRWLRRGWESFRLFSGDEINLASLPVLPLKGEDIENINQNARSFFDGLKPVAKGGTPNSVQSVPCDFSGQIFRFNVYIIPGRGSFQQVQNQFRWVEEYRGGKPDESYVKIIDKLGAEAKERGLDFKSHFDGNFPKLLAIEKNRVLQDVLTLEALRRSTGDSGETPDLLPITRTTFETLIENSIASNDWTQLENQARRLLSRDSTDTNAAVALAMSLFAQGRIADSIAIMKMGWPANKRAIGKLVKAYVGNDERGNQFSRLYRIADENNVSFPDLMQYALSADLEKDRKQETRIEQAAIAKEKLSNPSSSTSTENRSSPIEDKSSDAMDPVERLLTIIDQAMFAEDWDQAIEFSKALLIHRPENLMAKSKLAIALFINKQETQAQEIIDEIWDLQDDASGAEYLLANYGVLNAAGISHNLEDQLASKYRLDPDASLHTIRLILGNEDGKESWFLFESKRVHDAEVADQISQHARLSKSDESWSWDGILSYGRIIQRGTGVTTPSIDSIINEFSNRQRPPEIRDALIVTRSPTAEYLNAIWNLQRWQQRMKLLDQNPKLIEIDSEIFNRKNGERELMRRFNSASFRAMFLERWDEAESWARKALELNPEYPYGLGNLANSYLYRGKYTDAIEIYRKHWSQDVDGEIFGSLIVDDFEKLKAIGITHPDTRRILMELPPPKPIEP
jgi:tetratricopeptide (TPR) repeat protein